MANHPNRNTFSIPVNRKLIADLLKNFGSDPVTRGWCHAANFDAHAAYVVEVLDESKEPQGKNLKRHAITSAVLRGGLCNMAKNYPRCIGDVLDEDKHDAPLADLFVQCCVFGKEKYA